MTPVVERAQEQPERDHHERDELRSHRANGGGAADAKPSQEQVGDEQVEQLRQRRLGRVHNRGLREEAIRDAREVEAWLANFNECPVICTTHGKVPLDALLGISPRAIQQEHHQHPDYVTWQYSTACAYEQVALESALHQVRNTLRLKGIVRRQSGGSLVVQLVGARAEVSARQEEIDTGHLIAIGLADQIDPLQLNALFANDSAPSE